MDGKEIWENQKKIGQSRDAMAAYIISGDDDLARQLVESMKPEDVVTLALSLGRPYAFDQVEIFETSGASPEAAKELAVEHFRMLAGFGSLATE